MPDSKRLWVLALFLTACAGVVLALILSVEHVSHIQLPGCSADATFDCAAVNSSRFSEIRGIPIAFLGLVHYVLIAGLCVTRLRKGADKAAGAMAYAVLLALAGVSFSGVLFYVSSQILHKFCLYCIGLYVVSVASLILSMLALGGPFALVPAIRKDLADMGRQRPLVYGLAVVIVALVGFAAFKPGSIFNGPAEVSIPLGSHEKEKAKAREEILKAPALDPGAGDGYAKGSPTPILNIIEFADLECPACRVTSWKLAELVKKHPGEVRVVFRHYPLDMKCNSTVKRVIHTYACDSALAAEAAGLQGKFWEYHDAVYSKNDNIFKEGQPDLTSAALTQRAKNLGLDVAEFEKARASPEVLDKILSDIVDAGGFNVNSTPTLFINGRMVTGLHDEIHFETWLEMAKNGELPLKTANPPAHP